MVDEFQDTDPVQWKVIDRAFTDRSTLILIGDPKQAIYAFRGGDIVTYLKAAETAGVQKTLGDELAQRRRPGAATAGGPGGRRTRAIRGSSCTTSKRTTTGRASRAPRATIRSGCGSCAGTRSAAAEPARSLIGDLRSHIPADLAADIGALLTSGATFDGEAARSGRRRGDRREATRTPARVSTRCARPASRRCTPATPTSSNPPPPRTGCACWRRSTSRTAPGMVRAAAATMFFGKTAESLVEGGDALTDRRRRDVAGVGRSCPRARRRRHLRGRAAERHGRPGAVVAGRRTADDRPRAHDAAVAGGRAPRALQPARAARLAAGAARRGSGATERVRRWTTTRPPFRS